MKFHLCVAHHAVPGGVVPWAAHAVRFSLSQRPLPQGRHTAALTQCFSNAHFQRIKKDLIGKQLTSMESD